jgi:RNA polymerase sigma-70 factor (ECF subfamily)
MGAWTRGSKGRIRAPAGQIGEEPVRGEPMDRRGSESGSNARESSRVAPENALLRRARQYDEDALVTIYDRYAPRVYGYIYRRVGDAMLAESLVGEVFLRVLSAIQSRRAWRTSFEGWLYTIAHNLIVDQYRAQPDEPVLELEESGVAGGRDPPAALREKASRQRLLAAVQELTADQQQVLVLRFGEELTAREVAQVMGKSVSAVESLQHRGLEALRRRLGETEG